MRMAKRGPGAAAAAPVCGLLLQPRVCPLSVGEGGGQALPLLPRLLGDDTGVGCHVWVRVRDAVKNR